MSKEQTYTLSLEQLEDMVDYIQDNCLDSGACKSDVVREYIIAYLSSIST